MAEEVVNNEVTPENDSEQNREEAQENVIDINDEEALDNLSDEEFKASMDNLETEVPSVNAEQTEQTEQQVEQKNEDNPEVNEPQFKPSIDDKIFNDLPDDVKKIFSPIKANGAEIQPTPEEMIQLIQLGSKYYADREKIKPQLTMVNMMEKAGIKNQDDLILALDAVNGDKNAIAKLIKSKDIDLMELDDILSENDEVKYEPQVEKYAVDEAELANQMKLNDVDQQLKTSEHYDSLLTTLETMDPQSKNEFIKEPSKLLALNAHMESGLYQDTISEINKAKMLGQYVNTPFIDAYEEVASRLIQGQQKEPQVQTQVPRKEVQQVQRVAQESIPASIGQRNEPVAQVASSQKVIDLNSQNLDDMSDEAFRQMMKQLK